MTAPAEPSTSSLPQGQVSAFASPYWQGARAGLFGAALLALWFFFLDFSRGKPLYTPTVMGTALFRGGEGLTSPETLPTSIPLTLMFTLVHGLVFILIGVVGARLLSLIERGPNLTLGIVLLFAVLGLGFFSFAITFSAVALNAVQIQDVLIGNAIAAAGMAVYLLRHSPSGKAS